jgi:hypothetical protein
MPNSAELTRLVINLGLCHFPHNAPRKIHTTRIYTRDDELRVILQAMYVFFSFFLSSKFWKCPEPPGCHPTGEVADQSPLSHIPQYGILANSPSNAFHSTTSAAFQPQPAYDQMAVAAAAAAAAAANGQDYYQHQHQQPMMYMTPVTHNPPPNPLQPTVVDHVQTQPTAPVAGASPQSRSVSPGREASSALAARALNSSKRAEQNRKAQRAFRERRDA